MRQDPRRLHRQRAQLDAKLRKAAAGLPGLVPPRGGWVRATRESLGMTAQQLARRLGVTKANVLALERNERRRATSLRTLEKAAQGLGCRLVYALVPDQPLEKRVDARALEVARRQLGRVAHSMALEAQGSARSVDRQQLRELARELKARHLSELWEPS